MYTHKKRTYLARCVQWTNNTHEVVALLETSGVEVTPYGPTLMLRYTEWGSGLPHTKIDVFKPGMWIRIGENGVMKLETEQEFKLKYEPIGDQNE